MKAFIAILIIAAAILAAKELISYYRKTEVEPTSDQGRANQPPAQAAVAPEQLPGLPPSLEASLQQAEKEGAKTFRDWLTKYRAYVQDPRLAAIELDYVIIVSRDSPKEARQVFQSVKNRVPASSPVYERVQKLAKTYE
jgi:hypothetical protein